jgi:hypothetical protein
MISRREKFDPTGTRTPIFTPTELSRRIMLVYYLAYSLLLMKEATYCLETSEDLTTTVFTGRVAGHSAVTFHTGDEDISQLGFRDEQCKRNVY